MTKNKLTPGANLLWESSRMMLPEHKQILQHHQEKINRKMKPSLDDQQMEVFSQVISDAMAQNMNVKVQIFHPYQNNYIIGKIEKIAPERNKMQLSSKDNRQWVCFDKISNISLIEINDFNE